MYCKVVSRLDHTGPSQINRYRAATCQIFLNFTPFFLDFALALLNISAIAATAPTSLQQPLCWLPHSELSIRLSSGPSRCWMPLEMAHLFGVFTSFHSLRTAIFATSYHGSMLTYISYVASLPNTVMITTGDGLFLATIYLMALCFLASHCFVADLCLDRD